MLLPVKKADGSTVSSFIWLKRKLSIWDLSDRSNVTRSISRTFELNEDPLEGGCGSLVMKMEKMKIELLRNWFLHEATFLLYLCFVSLECISFWTIRKKERFWLVFLKMCHTNQYFPFIRLTSISYCTKFLRRINRCADRLFPWLYKERFDLVYIYL